MLSAIGQQEVTILWFMDVAGMSVATYEELQYLVGLIKTFCK